MLVFFVLSGFLITRLLLDERERTGRIDVVAFYVRRARRLLPALAIVLVATLAAAAVFGEMAIVGPQAFRAALYHANLATVVEPLGHAWTLSVEEQFYVAWPAIVVFAGAWVAAPLMVLLLAPFQVAAFGAIAAGASLARARPRAMPHWFAIPAGAVLLIATIISPDYSVALRLAVVAAALVLVLVALRPVPGLSNPALRYIGTISYGIYLWHVPVRWALTQAGLDATWSPWTLVGIGLSFGLAALSWHLVEIRILGRHRRLCRSAPAGD